MEEEPRNTEPDPERYGHRRAYEQDAREPFRQSGLVQYFFLAVHQAPDETNGMVFCLGVAYNGVQYKSGHEWPQEEEG